MRCKKPIKPERFLKIMSKVEKRLSIESYFDFISIHERVIPSNELNRHLRNLLLHNSYFPFENLEKNSKS